MLDTRKLQPMTHRILHIVPSLQRAGAEKQLVLLARQLAKQGYEIRVCAMVCGGPLVDELQDAGIQVEVLGQRFKADPLAWFRLFRLIKRWQPHLVHTWMFPANAYGRHAARWAGAPRLIASHRCVDLRQAAWQFAVDRHLAGVTDRIVVNAPGVAQFHADHGINRQRLQVIPNGVPAARPSRLSRDELLAMLGLEPSVRLIGAVGRLWPQKRVKDLIWASELLHLVQPNARLLVFGDGPLRRRLERFRSQVEADGHVLLLGHREDVADFLPHLEILWHASEYEGMPNAVMEAMAAGLPVVASDVSGNRDLVVPDVTGYLFPLGDRAELVHYTDRLLADAALRDRLGKAGQQRVADEFSVAAMVDQYLDLYQEIL